MGVIQDWGDEVNRMRARINPNARIEPTMLPPEVAANTRWQGQGVPQTAEGSVPTGLQGPGGGGAGAAGPEISPADILRRRLQQIPGTPDPRLRVPVGPGAPVAPAPAAVPPAGTTWGPQAPPSGAPPLARGQVPLSPEGQAFLDRPGITGKPPPPPAQVKMGPGGAPPGVMPAAGEAGAAEAPGMIRRVAQKAASSLAKWPESLGGKLVGGLGGAAFATEGARQIYDNPKDYEGYANVGIGGLAARNPLAALVGYAAYHGPKRLSQIFADERYGKEGEYPMAGRELKSVLGGRTPETYLAQRQQGGAAAPLPAPGTANPVANGPIEAMSARDKDVMMMDWEKSGRPPAQFIADAGAAPPVWGQGQALTGPTATAQPATAQPGRVATATPTVAAADVAKAAKKVGVDLPRLERNEEGNGYQLVHPNGEREDAVQIIYGASGHGAIAAGGEMVPYGPGESPQTAIQRYAATQAVNQRLQDKLAAGEPLTDDDVKAHAMANNLSTAEATKAQTERAVAATNAQGHMGGANIVAQGGVDVANIQAKQKSEEGQRPFPVSAPLDMYGKPVATPVYEPDTKSFRYPPGPKPDFYEFDTAYRNAPDKKAKAEIRAKYEARGGDVPKDYKYGKGGLIKSYALGGPIEDPYDYRAGEEEPEDYALRVNNNDVPLGAATQGIGAPPAPTAQEQYAQRLALGKSAGQDYAQGGPIQGPAGDDAVPGIVDGTTPARFTKDEYVIPVPVVKYYGTKFFDGLIAKYHERGKGQAKGP
jgi:hypothetical protein